MSFGDSVRALLDTYANCILLLKSFGRKQKDDGAVEVRQQPSRLREALKTDRLFVEQAYSSKLSESGSRFKEGDDPPQRKWRSVTQNTKIDPNGYEYNVHPVFPLRPYTVEVKKRRLFGLFGRKREA
ncbi:hypothetical protein MYCTH_2116990 [Thermothelomyces thermophilus ATCC 42464]|uniref:Uncharacterized protein n=1 Tax=Thermothelomyces thermophilus (strain ATCC 42464 / BCRC 31852 / DSM 1799) TaxID=573729 RepID=G2Q969_THET4|nr:uncharacterized protein MYCTH_2116990 [Thermothelomyces thermophilus ATCC 42464]AEO56361.1 hypothetical protein MYCTH_2116990 [Thermothelomyces thermophilus ATCC 42464]